MAVMALPGSDGSADDSISLRSADLLQELQTRSGPVNAVLRGGVFRSIRGPRQALTQEVV
jgi:hypothetical protein